MTNQLFTLNITLNSRTSDVPELTSLSISAVDREQAITKLFDNHLRYTNSVDIEELLKNNNSILITFK